MARKEQQYLCLDIQPAFAAHFSATLLRAATGAWHLRAELASRSRPDAAHGVLILGDHDREFVSTMQSLENGISVQVTESGSAVWTVPLPQSIAEHFLETVSSIRLPLCLDMGVVLDGCTWALTIDSNSIRYRIEWSTGLPELSGLVHRICTLAFLDQVVKDDLRDYLPDNDRTVRK